MDSESPRNSHLQVLVAAAQVTKLTLEFRSTMSGFVMGSGMRTEHFGQGGAGPVGGQGPRGMGPGAPAGYGRGREEYEDPNRKPDFRRDREAFIPFGFVFSCLDINLLHSCILVKKSSFLWMLAIY